MKDSNEIKTVDYLDGFQYAGSVLQFFPHAEGYVNATSMNRNNTEYTFNYVYNHTDHLGNIRVSYSKKPQTGELSIIEENHYYPFGLKHEVYSSLTPRGFIADKELGGTKLVTLREDEYKYKYNGKEWQDELNLNLYDYHARNYDPALGRWMNMDPLAEKFMDVSPYNYALNNPVIFIDPDGMEVINGDQQRMENAEENLTQISNEFNENYSGTDLKRKDFDDKKEFKQYKKDRRDLKKAEKELKQAKEAYQNTENAINYFKEIDPKGFEKMDNLTYKNKAGDEMDVDVIVTTGAPNDSGGGLTTATINTITGNIKNNVINVSIHGGFTMGTNGLAHEFGHAYAMANDPIGYYKNYNDHSCQDKSFRNHPITKEAMDWQFRYDRLYKQYKNDN